MRTLKEVAQYVGLTYKQGVDAKQLIRTETLFTVPRPSRPVALGLNTTPDEIRDHEVEKGIYREDIKNFVWRKELLNNNLSRAYNVVWGQCTHKMHSKVKSMVGYKNVHTNSDLLGLLELINLVSFDFHSQQNTYLAVIEVEKAFKNFRQGKTMTCEEHHEKFQSLSEAYVSCSGLVGNEDGLVEKELVAVGLTVGTATLDKTRNTKLTVQDTYLGCLFLYNANRTQFLRLRQDLHNDYLKNNDNYPHDLTKAHNILLNYKGPLATTNIHSRGRRETLTFVAPDFDDKTDEVINEAVLITP